MKNIYNKHYSIRKTKFGLKKNWIIIPSHLPNDQQHFFKKILFIIKCTFTNVFRLNAWVKTSILPPHIILCALRIKKESQRSKVSITYNHHTTTNNSNSSACDFFLFCSLTNPFYSKIISRVPTDKSFIRWKSIQP